jgi:hypothetical protein
VARPAIETRGRDAKRRGWEAAAIRLGGLIAVGLISVWGAVARSDANVATSLGVLLVASFLWLVFSGFFSYGAARRSDWVGLVPFAVALVVREFFTLHSVQEIEIQFARGPVGRHSVVYPLLQMFFAPLVRDPHRFTMHMNGVLGAFACLSLYLFIRHRLESRAAGFLCALFFATHPVVARLSPTDGPYALLLAAWFSGLALLCAPDLGAWSMLGGAGLLGIAATARIEGVAFLVASLLLLDLRKLVGAARRHRIAAICSFLVVYTQIAVHMDVLLPGYLSGRLGVGTMWALIPRVDWLLEDAVWPGPYNDSVFMSMVLIGAMAGVVRRYRFGLWAYLAMLVVLAPVGRSDAPFQLHRLVPTCAMQAMLAGIGAFALTAWLPLRRRWQWCIVLPGAAAAFYGLVQHREDLTRPYVFSEEYDLVRSHLAPGGIPAPGCTLLTFNATVWGDIDLHDFGQVVPGVRVLDCRSVDCVAELRDGECVYYVRSAACYYHPAGVPPACAAVGDPRKCMAPSCASFETSVELEPIELRTIDILSTFPDRRLNYPQHAEVGLFIVRART